MSLYDAQGHRTYLIAEERDAFLKTAEHAPRDVRTLCGMLASTGCRISEALALTADRVDLTANLIMLESLKKRRRGVYRAIPVPPPFLDVLDLVHGIREAQAHPDAGRKHRLWPWSRMTAWRRFRAILQQAGITGSHAIPTGLRHGFGVAAISAGVPLTLVQTWLGHAKLTITAIYSNAMGAEEPSIAARMWEENRPLALP